MYKNECIVAVKKGSGQDSEEIAFHKAILDKPESASSHATTYHHRKVQFLYCMLIMYFYIHVAYVLLCCTIKCQWLCYLIATENSENDLHQRHEENSPKWGMA